MPAAKIVFIFFSSHTFHENVDVGLGSKRTVAGRGQTCLLELQDDSVPSLPLGALSPSLRLPNIKLCFGFTLFHIVQLLSVKRRLYRASKKIGALESTVSVLKEEGSGLRRTVKEGTAKQGETTRNASEKRHLRSMARENKYE